MRKKHSHLIEKRLKKQQIHESPSGLVVRDDVVKLPSGGKATRLFFEHPGAAAVLAFKDPKTLVMVRQHRYPVDTVTQEIPAGKLNSRRENPLASIKRELLEETGYKARRWKKLIPYWPTPAFSDEVLHLYAAFDLTPGAQHLDEDEFVDVVEVPYQKVLRDVLSGRNLDSKTIIAVLAYEALKRKTRP